MRYIRGDRPFMSVLSAAYTRRRIRLRTTAERLIFFETLTPTLGELTGVTPV